MDKEPKKLNIPVPVPATVCQPLPINANLKFKPKRQGRNSTYQGVFVPSHPEKYKGNVNSIVFRSSWEYSAMKYFDTCDQVVEWSSEEIVVPYLHPLDNAMHRYYPDFWVKLKTKTEIFRYILGEIKPYAQTIAPKPLPPGKKATKRMIDEMTTYVINQAKWKYAAAWAKQKGWEFKWFTEKDLFTRKK